MKNVRLLITEKCNASCDNCFNANYRCDRELSMSNVECVAMLLSKSGVETIFVEGGEPTIHSCFQEIMKFLQLHFSKVVLFTNALSSELLSFSPRISDGIVYNFNFLNDEFDDAKLLKNMPGKRSFMIQVSTYTNVDDLISRIKSFAAYLQKEEFSLILTLDCTVDIFQNSEILAKKWNQIVAICIINRWNLKIDHSFPLCLKERHQCLMIEIYKNRVEDISEKRGLYWCDHHRAGLIDSNLKLRFCNNFSRESLSIIEDTKVVSSEKIERFLLNTEKMKDAQLPDSCRSCSYYLNHTCNATCFGCRT